MRRARVGLLAAWSIVAVPVTQAQYVFPPVLLGGELSYSLRDQRDDEGRRSFDRFLTARLNATTFIWQPWFALLSGDLSATMSDTTLSDELGEERTVEGDGYGGGLNLDLFPSSRFPFRAYVDYRETQLDETVNRVGLTPRLRDFTSTRYGVRQDYVTRDSRTRLNFRAEHGNFDDRFGTSSTRDIVSAGASSAYKGHSLNFSSSWQRVDQEPSGNTTTDISAALVHRYSPSPRLSFDDVASLDVTRSEFGESNSGFGTFELRNRTTWNPLTRRPLRVIGDFRLQQAFNRGDLSDPGSAFWSASGTALYDWRPDTRLSASAGVRFTNTDLRSTFQRVGVRYTNPGYQFGRWRYDWGAGTDLENQTFQDGTRQLVTVGGDHSVSRNWAVSPNSALSFTFAQALTASEQYSEVSDDLSRQDFTNRVSLAWSSRVGRGSVNANLNANDTRTFGDRPRDFQFVRLGLNGQYPLTRYGSLAFSANAQATRSANPEVDEQPAWRALYGASGRYVHGRVFGVRRLRFESDAQYSSSTLLGEEEEEGDIFGDSDTITTLAWRNRLLYAIGRLDLELSASIAETESDRITVLFFRVRRTFGFR